ncbi:MAG: plasmid mobilization relaxosome protein MobC [Methylococcaceae bacterium]|nr:plasmid mobilization relaxosome protein MobC [Methylococcaceae bacterium]
MKKEKREIHVGTRMTESEYAEFMLKNRDASGKSIMSNSNFIRTSLVNSSIKVNNQEVEQYQCFILGKISNNINQFTKRLHEDNKAERINDATYKKILEELVALNEEIFHLTLPIR